MRKGSGKSRAATTVHSVIVASNEPFVAYAWAGATKRDIIEHRRSTAGPKHRSRFSWPADGVLCLMWQEYRGGIPRDEALLSWAMGVWSWCAMGVYQGYSFPLKVLQV